MRRLLVVALAGIGPACVALLRLELPYYGASGNAAQAAAVGADPGREDLVVWLGLVAVLTLVPGLYTVRGRLPSHGLAPWAFGLTALGYCSLPIVLVGDFVMAAGVHRHLSSATTGGLLSGLPVAYGVGIGIFVAAHVVGTTLLGVVCLRHRLLPRWVGVGLLVSQPLHFTTAVFLGLPWLDLIAWGTTAVAMGWLAAEPGPVDVAVARPAAMAA